MYKIGQEEIDAVARVIRSGDLFKINNGAREVAHAEEKICKLFGCKNAIMMTSGQGSLISALTAMGIGPGDEVIVPAYTYIATAMAVLAVGAIPVIVEADETLTLDPIAVEKAITPYTKALLPVHIQGFACNMDALMAIAKKHNLLVLEDACQSVGGTYHGKHLGTIGDIGALSFNFYKVITAGGEGGALLTDNRTFFERALIYHDSSAIAFFGDQLGDVTEPVFGGDEYRVSEVSGAILGVQLDRLDGILVNLRQNHDRISAALSDICTLRPSNDPTGECPTTVAVRFASEAEARRFATAENVYGVLPIDTGKHVYTNWTCVLEKRGAFHPAMDPYKRPENAACNMNYSLDMCPNTLDYLARTVYIAIDPYWTEEAITEKIAALRKAAKEAIA